MSHSLHSDIHSDGLADGCERCAEMAADPFGTLDQDALRELVQRTLNDRFSTQSAPPRSTNEAVAMAYVLTQLEHTGQLFSAAPSETSYYLRDRWRINVGITEEV